MNINPAYRAAELTYALNQASVSALVLAKGLKGSREFIEIVDSVVAQTQLRHRILLADEAPEGEPAVLRCGVVCWAVSRAAPIVLADNLRVNSLLCWALPLAFAADWSRGPGPGPSCAVSLLALP